MIKVQELTPEIYYKQSRDFQFIGRLYDIVLNYIKTNATNLYTLPIGKNMNEQLLNLLALTLGFKTTKNYNSKQLLAICSVLPSILRNKGSIQALIIATNALLSAESITQALDYSIEPKKSITLYLSQELTDLSLLQDLLDYILPAGMCCQMVRESQSVKSAKTSITMRDTVTVYSSKTDLEISRIAASENRQDETAEDYLKLNNLVLGRIGNQSSILANVTIVKKEDN